MGGRSKSSSSNNSSQTSSTMANLKNQGVSNEKVAGMQQSLANSQLGSILPIFSEMVQSGQGMFGSNPMMNVMGAMFGQPIQMQTPDFLSEFIQKYNPPAPEQPTQEQLYGKIPTMPNGQPFNINDHMRNRFMR